MAGNKRIAQKIWGIILVLTGIAMFFMIPRKVTEIADTFALTSTGKYPIYFCFYLISVLLTAGGGIKVYKNFSFSGKEQDIEND